MKSDQNVSQKVNILGKVVFVKGVKKNALSKFIYLNFSTTYLLKQL